MSHEPVRQPGGMIAYKIDKNKMDLCISEHCTHFVYGFCTKAECIHTGEKETDDVIFTIQGDPRTIISPRDEPTYREITKSEAELIREINPKPSTLIVMDGGEPTVIIPLVFPIVVEVYPNDADPDEEHFLLFTEKDWNKLIKWAEDEWSPCSVEIY